MNVTPIHRPVSFVAIFVLLPLVCSGGCQQGSETPMDRTAAKELCTRFWMDYLETLRSVQPGKIAGWFTKDALLIYPNMAELKSRDSIEAFVAKVLPGTKYLEITFTLQHFDVVGPKAYTFVTLNELVEKGGKIQTRYHTRCGAVWQRQADNTWQISHYLINPLKM